MREAQSEPVAKPAALVAEAKPVVPPAKAKTESADPLGDLAQSKMATKTAAVLVRPSREAESSVVRLAGVLASLPEEWINQ